MGNTKEEIQQILRDGIKMGNRTIKVGFKHISDLKAMDQCTNLKGKSLSSAVSEMFCLFCNTLRADRFNVEHRNDIHKRSGSERLNDIFGIPDDDHLFCILHCKQRITEYLLKMMVHGEKAKADAMEKFLSNTKGLTNFKIIEKVSKVDQTVLGYDIKMLKGGQCDLVIKNYKELIDALPGLNRNQSAIQRNIWKLWENIVKKYLEASNATLNFVKPQVTADVDMFAKLVRRANSTTGSFPYYMHIIWAHLPDVLEEYRSLTVFSNSGFENSHQLHRLVYRRGVSRKGDPLEQLMNYQLRRMTMCIKLKKASWVKKYKNENEQAKREVGRKAKREEKGIDTTEVDDTVLNDMAVRVCKRQKMSVDE